MSETIYLSSVDTAKLLRKELKSNFPKTKFSVTSDHNSIRVSYNGAGGGPIWEDVDNVAHRFAGGGFDGMIDLAYSKSHYMLPDGTFITGKSMGTAGSMGYVEGWENEMPEGAVEVHFGSTYVFVNDHGPTRHRENCEWSDMDWCPMGGCTRGIPKREEDVIHGKAVPFHSIG